MIMSLWLYNILIGYFTVTETIERIRNTSELIMKDGGKSMITYPTTAKYKNHHWPLSIICFQFNPKMDK